MSKLKNEDKTFKMDFFLVNDADDKENRINKNIHRDYIDHLMDFSSVNNIRNIFNETDESFSWMNYSFNGVDCLYPWMNYSFNEINNPSSWEHLK